MKIAQLISRSGCSSGGSIQALLLARALIRRGYDVLFVSRGGDCSRRARELGIPHAENPMSWHPLELVGFVRMLKDYHVLHAHKGKALSLSLFCAFITGRNRVFANRGVSFPLSWSNLWKYRLPLTRKVVCVSFGIKRLLARQGLNPEKLAVVYGSLHDRFFVPVDGRKARASLGLEREFALCLVGNFRPWKGHLLLASASRMLWNHGIPVRLVFAGKEKPSLLSRVKALVEGRVLSLGYRRDVEVVMSACDVLVNASTDGEGVPGVVREAMALGVPVVASSLEGNVEMIRHAKNGLLFPVGDEGKLYRFLKILFCHPRLRRRLGVNGKRFAGRFTMEARAEYMLRVYGA